MSDSKSTGRTQSADLELTDANGKRVLVNAFDIAVVREHVDGCQLVLKDVHVAIASGSHYGKKIEGFTVPVQNNFDEIKQMRRELGF